MQKTNPSCRLILDTCIFVEAMAGYLDVAAARNETGRRKLKVSVSQAILELALHHPKIQLCTSSDTWEEVQRLCLTGKKANDLFGPRTVFERLNKLTDWKENALFLPTRSQHTRCRDKGDIPFIQLAKAATVNFNGAVMLATHDYDLLRLEDEGKKNGYTIAHPDDLAAPLSAITGSKIIGQLTNQNSGQQNKPRPKFAPMS